MWLCSLCQELSGLMLLVGLSFQSGVCGGVEVCLFWGGEGFTHPFLSSTDHQEQEKKIIYICGRPANLKRMIMLRWELKNLGVTPNCIGCLIRQRHMVL